MAEVPEDVGINELDPEAGLSRRDLLIGTFAGAALMTGIGRWLRLGTSESDALAPVPTSTSTTSTTLETIYLEEPAETAECGPDHLVELADNTGNKLDVNGILGVTSEEIRAEMLAFNAIDPRGLFLYYNASPLGESKPLGSVDELVEGPIQDGACYSDRGQEAYTEWAALWTTAKITPVARVRHRGVNTGVTGINTVSFSKGVGGKNLAGADVDFVDAQGNVSGSHSCLKRCKQPTTGQPPKNVPEGPTDNPPPERKPKEAKELPKEGSRTYDAPADNDPGSGSHEVTPERPVPVDPANTGQNPNGFLPNADPNPSTTTTPPGSAPVGPGGEAPPTTLAPPTSVPARR